MAQRLKQEVRDRIRGAALAVFAASGYERATVGAIAREAGVSTGNIYRYFDGKEDLFAAVLPDGLVRRYRELVAEQVRAARGLDALRGLPADHPYPRSVERLLDFAVEHRLELVLLLGRAEGTRHEGVREQVVDQLVTSALGHFGIRARDLPETHRFDLQQIYRNYVASLVRILERFERGEQIREAARAYARYHLNGLQSLLG